MPLVKKPLCNETCFPEQEVFGWTPSCWWVVKQFFVLLCLYVQLLFYPVNCLRLSPQDLALLPFWSFHPSSLGRGSEQLRGAQLPTRLNHNASHCLQASPNMHCHLSPSYPKREALPRSFLQLWSFFSFQSPLALQDYLFLGTCLFSLLFFLDPQSAHLPIKIVTWPAF